MNRRSLVALSGLALAAGCAQLPPRPTPANLPTSLQNTVTDPGRSAIGMTNAVFGNPSSVAGRPVVVADAIAQLEWLAVNLQTDQRWIGLQPTVIPSVIAGRDEVRAAFGVRPDTTPNAAIAAFDGAAAALRTGNAAAAESALGTVTGPGGAARAVALLSALPVLRQAAAGTSAASNGLMQLDTTAGPRSR